VGQIGPPGVAALARCSGIAFRTAPAQPNRFAPIRSVIIDEPLYKGQKLPAFPIPKLDPKQGVGGAEGEAGKEPTPFIHIDSTMYGGGFWQ
jgi:hypothetical protein